MEARIILMGVKREEGEYTRFMLSVRVPPEKGNQLVREGELAEVLQSIMEDLKPEAAYFTDIDGARGAIFIVNMDDASQLPAMAEPLYHGVNATVKAQVVLTPEDFQRAAPALEQVVQKYG
jgi:hypothetical protein